MSVIIEEDERYIDDKWFPDGKPNIFAYGYEEIKDKLVPHLISVEGHEELLHKVPCMYFDDMALVYDVVITDESDREHYFNVNVSNRNLELWKVDHATVHMDALRYAPSLHPGTLRRLDDCLKDAFPEVLPDVWGSPELFVASVSDGFLGAAVIMYPGFLDRARKILGGDFYILPSSVHEVLLLRTDCGTSVEELRALVREVNETVVARRDRLSNSVFRYSGEMFCSVNEEEELYRVS